jgi:hypothetical protein
MKKGEVGGACSTHGIGEKCMQDFSHENVKEIDHFGDLGVVERLALKFILK